MKMILSSKSEEISPRRFFDSVVNYLELRDVKLLYECTVTISDSTYITLLPDDALIFSCADDPFKESRTDDAFDDLL